MGYCEGGDLYSKLKEHGKRSEHLSEKQIVEWFVQIAMALQVIPFMLLAFFVRSCEQKWTMPP